MHILCYAICIMLVIGPINALAAPPVAQEVTDQIQRKAKELIDAGYPVSISQSDRPALVLQRIRPIENLAKVIDLLEDFPHPLNIDLLNRENPRNLKELGIDLTKLCDLRVEQLSISGEYKGSGLGQVSYWSHRADQWHLKRK